MDELIPTNGARDVSGAGHTAWLQGSASWRHSGVLGEAVLLPEYGAEGSGVPGYVRVESSTGLGFPNGLTAMAWVYMENPHPSNPWPAILGKGDGSAYLLYVNTATAAHRVVSFKAEVQGQGVVDVGCFKIPLKKWTHVAVSFDGSTLRCYRDGALLRSIPGLPGRLGGNTEELLVGARPVQGVAGGFWKGVLDDVRLYEGALSPEELQHLVPAPPSSTSSFFGINSWQPDVASLQSAGGVKWNRYAAFWKTLESTPDDPCHLETGGPEPYCWSRLEPNPDDPGGYRSAYEVVSGHRTAGVEMLMEMVEPPAHHCLHCTGEGLDSNGECRVCQEGSTPHLYDDVRQSPYYTFARAVVRKLNSFYDDYHVTNFSGFNEPDIHYRRLYKHYPLSPSVRPVVELQFDADPILLAPGSSVLNSAALGGEVFPGHGEVEGTELRMERSAIHGQSARFTGDSFVSIADSRGSNPRARLSVSAWVLPAPDASDPWPTIAGKGDGAPYLLYRHTEDGTLNFKARLSGDTLDLACFPLPAGQWSHVAVTYDGGTLRCYRNGRLVQELADLPGELTPDEEYPISIGGRMSRDGWGSLWQGQLDEVRIDHVALTEMDLRALMASAYPFLYVQAVMKPLYQGIKEGCAELGLACHVLGADFSTWDATHYQREFHEGLAAAGAFQYVDILSYHAYQGLGTDDLGGVLRELDAENQWLRDQNLALPIWVTETGRKAACGNDGYENAATQAQWLRQLTEDSFSRPWLQRMFFYYLKDHTTCDFDSDAGWGLYTHDGQPRPALTVLKELTTYYERRAK
jgi:hypothetical protein